MVEDKEARKDGASAAPKYPRPASSLDNAFYYEGLARRKLLVQKCAGCGRLRNPPAAMCPHCRSVDWSPQRCSGKGLVHSFTVHHHPPVPPFELPLAIVLVDLEEGIRFVAGLRRAKPETVRIGMPVSMEFHEVEPGYVLPVFVPA